MDEPPFKIIKAVEAIQQERNVRQFITDPRTQMVIGAVLKRAAAMELGRMKKRDAERQNPELFPEIVEQEVAQDRVDAMLLTEAAERGERFLTAGKRRSAFAVLPSPPNSIEDGR